MKRLLSFLLVFCLLLSCCAVALAATRPVISAQPETQTVNAGGTVTYKIKARGFSAITWYFVDPATGQEITARHITEKFKDLKVKNPNGSNLILKKVPLEMDGWSLYCHLVGNGYKVDSDTVMILVTEPAPAATATPAPTPVPTEAPTATPAPEQESPDTATAQPEQGSPDAATAEPEPTETPRLSESIEEIPDSINPFTVTVSGELELYKLSRSGKPTGEPQTTLSFDDIAAFYVKANGTIQYLLINDLQLTPTSDDVVGMTIRGIMKDTIIQGRVLKASADTEEKPEEPVITAVPAEPTAVPEEPTAVPEEPTPVPEEPTAVPEEPTPVLEEPTAAPEEPADTAGKVLVTCERCRFSGGGNSFTTSGYVPVGTTITVVCGSGGLLSEGYSINGAPAVNKGQASFKMTVTEDTTITMQQR